MTYSQASIKVAWAEEHTLLEMNSSIIGAAGAISTFEGSQCGVSPLDCQWLSGVHYNLAGSTKREP